MGRTIRLIQALGITILLLCYSGSSLAVDDAAALRKQYAALLPKLNNNQFQRPLHLDSVELPTNLKADIYGIVDYSFTGVNGALNDPKHGPANWCDVLMLHLNTKCCHASSASNGKRLIVNVGKKVEQPLADTYRMEFNYRAVIASPEYFRVDLNASRGPLDTRDYHIVLEAVAIDGKRTFLHLSYSYSSGTAGSIAMKTYLATAGRNKVGFTGIGRQPNGLPIYVSGVRGVLERNTMRYYLAIDAYLSGLSLPADKQLEKRLSHWFGATYQYSRQLHEVEREEYMRMKYREYQRQQTTQ
jgi:hypothetical protein